MITISKGVAHWLFLQYSAGTCQSSQWFLWVLSINLLMWPQKYTNSPLLSFALKYILLKLKHLTAGKSRHPLKCPAVLCAKRGWQKTLSPIIVSTHASQWHHTRLLFQSITKQEKFLLFWTWQLNRNFERKFFNVGLNLFLATSNYVQNLKQW